MAFDECPPYPCDYSYAKNSMNLTHRWLDRCISRFNNTPAKYNYKQIFFPIVQGSTYKDLRKTSVHNLGFYCFLMSEARKKIIEGDFLNWKDKMVKKLNNRL